MCSRFELSAGSGDLVRRFGLTVPPPLPARREMRPTDAVLVIGPGGPALLPWGLEVEWQPGPLINARAETLADKATFRPLLAAGRVLVPATGWWEWPSRRKTRVAPAAGGPFAFAGLTDGRRVVVVTCAPAAELAMVHDRMPVVLAAGDEAAWADPAVPFAGVAPLLRPLAVPFAVSAEPVPPSAQGDLFG